MCKKKSEKMSWYTKSRIIQKVLRFVVLAMVILLGQKRRIIARSGHDRKYLKLEINFHPKF